MTELDDFLTTTIPRQDKAEEAVHNGDIGPREELWTRADPVTLFGAWGPCDSGWADVHRTFEWVGSRFSDCTEYHFEVIAAGASGDLAYTVGYERFAGSVDGNPHDLHTLRVTHIYRRENGEWKIVHRHADDLPINQSPQAK